MEKRTPANRYLLLALFNIIPAVLFFLLFHWLGFFCTAAACIVLSFFNYRWTVRARAFVLFQVYKHILIACFVVLASYLYHSDLCEALSNGSISLAVSAFPLGITIIAFGCLKSDTNRAKLQNEAEYSISVIEE